jgi:hypothetical protein
MSQGQGQRRRATGDERAQPCPEAHVRSVGRP